MAHGPLVDFYLNFKQLIEATRIDYLPEALMRDVFSTIK